MIKSSYFGPRHFIRRMYYFFFAENATCRKVRCRGREKCLNDSVTGMPRCVTCTHRCKSRHMNGSICGSNNSTYQSWCHMIQDACVKGFTIETKHSGKCVSYYYNYYSILKCWLHYRGTGWATKRCVRSYFMLEMLNAPFCWSSCYLLLLQ